MWWNLFDNKQVALCVMRGCTGLINRSQLSTLFKHLYVLMPIFWENMGIRPCRKYTQHVLLIRGSCSLVHTHTAVTNYIMPTTVTTTVADVTLALTRWLKLQEVDNLVWLEAAAILHINPFLSLMLLANVSSLVQPSFSTNCGYQKNATIAKTIQIKKNILVALR